jgi:hypothetical protein
MAKNKFFIDTGKIVELKEGHEEIKLEAGVMSITPRTFVSRTLLQNNNQLLKTKARLDDIAKATEALENQKQSIGVVVEKFKTDLQNLQISEGDISGCMSKLDPFLSDITMKYCQSKIIMLQEYSRQLGEYRSFLADSKNQDLVLSYKDIFDNGDVLIGRYGINVMEMSDAQAQSLREIYCTTEKKPDGSLKSGSGSKKKDNISPIQLHPLEIFQIEDAMLSLKDDDVGLSVLVDIFARNEDGSIKITKSGLIETHTIVLYKNGAKKFAVIDPSNSDFSKHILWNSEILLGVKDIEICVPNSLIKIYIPGSQDNVGPGQDQYRDCIDIAYKIAANLKRVNPDSFDLKQLKDHETIKMLSNSPEIDRSILVEGVAMRIKQSSDINIVRVFNQMEHIITDDMSIVESYSKVDHNNILLDMQGRHQEIMKFSSNETLLKCLVECHREFMGLVVSYAKVHERHEMLSELLGQAVIEEDWS